MSVLLAFALWFVSVATVVNTVSILWSRRRRLADLPRELRRGQLSALKDEEFLPVPSENSVWARAAILGYRGELARVRDRNRVSNLVSRLERRRIHLVSASPAIYALGGAALVKAAESAISAFKSEAINRASLPLETPEIAVISVFSRGTICSVAALVLLGVLLKAQGTLARITAEVDRAVSELKSQVPRSDD